MRQRLALGWTLLIVLLALALPATTLAASYNHKITRNECGASKVFLTVKAIAPGTTPGNKLTIDSWAQEKHGGVWQTTWVWNQVKYTYTPDGTKHTLTVARNYPFMTYTARIVMQVRAFSGHTQLYSATVRSVRCVFPY